MKERELASSRIYRALFLLLSFLSFNLASCDSIPEEDCNCEVLTCEKNELRLFLEGRCYLVNFPPYLVPQFYGDITNQVSVIPLSTDQAAVGTFNNGDEGKVIVSAMFKEKADEGVKIIVEIHSPQDELVSFLTFDGNKPFDPNKLVDFLSTENLPEGEYVVTILAGKFDENGKRIPDYSADLSQLMLFLYSEKNFGDSFQCPLPTPVPGRQVQRLLDPRTAITIRPEETSLVDDENPGVIFHSSLVEDVDA